MEYTEWNGTDDKIHVTDALIYLLSPGDVSKARRMSYGDFGRYLEKTRRNSGSANGLYDIECRNKIRIKLCSMHKLYELTYNKAAKAIHERVMSTAARDAARNEDTVTEEQIIEVSALVSPGPQEDDDYNADYNDDSESGEEVTNISPQYAEAVRCHSDIIAGAELAQQGLYQMAAGFRKMRDEKLYKALGYSSFEGYCEKETGLVRSAVYRYIAIAEKLPEDFVLSRGQIGVKKLELLSTLTEEQRAEIADDTDLESTTVRQLRERIDELTGAVEREKELKEEYRRQGSADISELKRELNDTKRIKNEIAAEVGRMKGLRQEDLADMSRLKKMILDQFKEMSELEQKLSDAESGEVRLTDEQIEDIAQESVLVSDLREQIEQLGIEKEGGERMCDELQGRINELEHEIKELEARPVDVIAEDAGAKEQRELRIREAEFAVKYKAAFEYVKMLCIFTHSKGTEEMKRRALSLCELIKTTV